MSVTVRIPTQLRSLSGERVGGAGRGRHRRRGVEGAREPRIPGSPSGLFDETGGLRRFVNVFLADEDIRFLQGVDSPVTDGQTISIVPAVAGG